MKKLIYSGALVALLLAGCGTDTEDQAKTGSTPTEQQNEQSSEQSMSEQAEQTEQQTATEENTNTSATNNTTPTTSQPGEAEQNTNLTLYSSNEDATAIVPFEVKYEGAKNQIVPFIFEKVDAFETNLLDYKFENDGVTLVLNIADSIFNVQGSAGSTMYVHTLAQSFFDNFPSLNEVTFLYNGSAEPVLDHLNIGQPYTRADITTISQ